MRLLVPLLLVAISGNCLAQTQHLMDTRSSLAVQPESGTVTAQTPFSGPPPMSSSLFRSPGADPATYDNLGIRQAKPAPGDASARCRQQAAPAAGCTAKQASGVN